jgi:Acetyltransferase (GNAT) family
VEFRLVDPSEGRQVYQWHRGFAAANEHLFPRPWERYSALAEDGRIWCAVDHRGDYVGLAYFCLENNEWEIGGLMVASAERNKGIASVLARATLGHLLFEEDPLSRRESVISHVHAENDDPRALIENVLGFRYRRSICVPGSALPGLKTNADGNVEGDEFEIAIGISLPALSNWCDVWIGALKDGRHAQITLRPGTSLSMWASAFRDMAQKHALQQPSGPTS